MKGKCEICGETAELTRVSACACDEDAPHAFLCEDCKKKYFDYMTASFSGMFCYIPSVTYEPVIQQDFVLTILSMLNPNIRVKIGKLNYHQSDINWAQFGLDAEKICRSRGLDYYIKDSLRKCMEA